MEDDDVPTLRSLEFADTVPAPRGTWFTTNKPNRCFWCGVYYPDAFALSSTTAEERTELKARCKSLHHPECIYIPVISIVPA